LELEELSVELNVSKADLVLASRNAKGYGYHTFRLPKRSGGNRTIRAPRRRLAEIQRSIANFVSTRLSTGESVHGFVRNRNIISNAKHHCNREFLLTLDICDFFDSVFEEAIAEQLMRPPISLAREAALLVAKIVTHEGVLPQGASTSPVMSNLVCRQMDSELRLLALQCRCHYTRYADDLAFSTDEDKFPVDVAEEVGPAPGHVMVSGRVQEILGRYGFKVNFKKVHLLRRHERQAVCGVIVNEKLSVRNSIARSIRSMLHGIERYGIESYASTYRVSRRLAPEHDVVATLRGRLAYLKAVEGPGSRKYRRLASSAHRVLPQSFPAVDLSLSSDQLVIDEWVRALVSVDVGSDDLLRVALPGLRLGSYVVVGVPPTLVGTFRCDGRSYSDISYDGRGTPRGHAVDTPEPAHGESVAILIADPSTPVRSARIEYKPEFGRERVVEIRLNDGTHRIPDGALVIDARSSLVGFSLSQGATTILHRQFRVLGTR
jgi:hypothetical protein